MSPYNEIEVIRMTKEELQKYDRAMKQVIPDWRYETLHDCISMQTHIVNLVKDLDPRYDVFFDYTFDLLRRLRNMYFKIY